MRKGPRNSPLALPLDLSGPPQAPQPRPTTTTTATRAASLLVLVDHEAVIGRVLAEVAQRAKELKALNGAAKDGLVAYLEAVTALDEAETMGLDAVMKRVKRSSEGGEDVTAMYKNQMEYELRNLENVHEYAAARNRQVAVGQELAANVTTSKLKNAKVT